MRFVDETKKTSLPCWKTLEIHKSMIQTFDRHWHDIKKKRRSYSWSIVQINFKFHHTWIVLYVYRSARVLEMSQLCWKMKEFMWYLVEHLRTRCVNKIVSCYGTRWCKNDDRLRLSACKCEFETVVVGSAGNGNASGQRPRIDLAVTRQVDAQADLRKRSDGQVVSEQTIQQS